MDHDTGKVSLRTLEVSKIFSASHRLSETHNEGWPEENTKHFFRILNSSVFRLMMNRLTLICHMAREKCNKAGSYITHEKGMAENS